jgi:hypothetical protein
MKELSEIETKWNEQVSEHIYSAGRAAQRLNIPMKWECVIGDEVFYYESNGMTGAACRETSGRRPK